MVSNKITWDTFVEEVSNFIKHQSERHGSIGPHSWVVKVSSLRNGILTINLCYPEEDGSNRKFDYALLREKLGVEKEEGECKW